MDSQGRVDGRDGLELAEGARTLRVQRLAAYGVATAGGGTGARILLARLSARTGTPGGWTLPGGGVEHGEHPRDAVVREFLEETGLPADVGALLDVDSVRRVHAIPGDEEEPVVEDFHAVRVLYAVTVPDDVPPRVVEVDGSTDAVAWVGLSAVDDLSLVPLARLGLAHARRALGLV
ncbi:MAG: NUDIX hydrolase [Motilibacteraceae bacterium]